MLKTENRIPMQALIAPATFALIAAVYLWSAPRTVVLEDDGYFLQAAFFAAPAHPPGYPLYVALAHLAAKFPFWSFAYRIHALSALIGAAACVLLYAFALRIGMTRAGACLAALALGFSEAFWSQSIIAEVYGLHVLLLLLLMSWAARRAAPGELHGTGAAFAFGLVCGLGLANHWPLLLLAMPALCCLLYPCRQPFLSQWRVLLPGLAAGLTPYLWLIWRTHAVPEYCFDGPIKNLNDFWFFVSREGYAGADQSPSASWHDKLRFAGFSLQEVAGQFGIPGIPLMLLGLARQWRQWPRHVCLAVVVLFLCGTFGLSLLLGFDFDLLHRNTFRVYLLPAHAAAALWFALGALHLLELLRVRANASTRSARAVHWFVVVALAVAVLLANSAANYRAGDRWAERYASVLLESLPADAVLYANADTITGPIGYLHHVDAVRPDIQLQSGSAFHSADTLYRPYRLGMAESRKLFDAYLLAGSRPMYYTNDFPNSRGTEDHGLYFRAVPGTPASDRRVVRAPGIWSYLEAISRLPEPRDPWEAMHYRLLREDHCRLWLSTQSRQLNRNPGSSVAPACDHYLGLLRSAQFLLLRGEPPATAHVFLELAAGRRHEATTREDYAELDVLRGDAALAVHDRSGAERAYRRALDAWPHHENPVRGRLDLL